MKRWSWWPLHLCLLFLSSFWISGCVPARQEIRLPPPSAPFQARKEAYQDLKAVVIHRTVYATRSSFRVVNRLRLNNGMIIYNPLDLVDIVGSNTRTAEYAAKYAALRRKQRTMFWSSFGVALAGTALTIAAIAPPGDARPYGSVVESPLFWTGVGITAVASLTMGLATPIFGLPAAQYQRRAFRTYNRDLRRRLRLRKVPRYRYRDNTRPPNGPDNNPPRQQTPPPQDTFRDARPQKISH